MKNLNEISEQYEKLLSMVMTGEFLSEREMSLIALTVATVLEDSKAVELAVNTAKQMGFSNEETEYINLVIALLKAQKVVGLKPSKCNCNTTRCC